MNPSVPLPSQARLPPSCLLPPDIAELCAGQWSHHRRPPLLLVCAPESVDFVVFTFTLPGPHMMTVTVSMWLSNNYRERPLWGTRQLLIQAPPSMDFPGKWGRLSYLSLLFFRTLHSNGNIFPFLLFFSLLFFSQLFLRPPQTAILLFCISFPWGWSWSLSPAQYHEPAPIVHQALYHI